MKYNFLLGACIFFLFACSEKDGGQADSSDLFDGFSFQIDTVLVDSGEELMLLEGNYMGDFTLSPDRSRLYIFSAKNYILQEVDLDQLTLIGKKTFEKEGPDGVGDYLKSLHQLENGNLVFSNYSGTGVFSLDGKNLSRYMLKSSEIDGIDLKDDFPLNTNAKIYGDGNSLFAINAFEKDYQLVEVNLSSQTGNQWSMPALNLTKNFQTIFVTGVPTRFFSLSPRIDWVNQQVIISSPATNEIYVYQAEQDSLRHVAFPHTLVALTKEGTYNQNANSIEEFQKIMTDISSQVEFGPIMWDANRKLYFRLSKVEIPNLDDEAPKRYENYIHAFDSDFELVGEAQLKGIDQKLTNEVFIKDGKLWSYVNVEDELGFAVITLKLN